MVLYVPVATMPSYSIYLPDEWDEYVAQLRDEAGLENRSQAIKLALQEHRMEHREVDE